MLVEKEATKLLTVTRRRTAYFSLAFAVTTGLALSHANAQSGGTSLSTYGTPGLIETPTARSLMMVNWRLLQVWSGQPSKHCVVSDLATRFGQFSVHTY